MNIFVPKETAKGEQRIAMLPQAVKKLCELGATVTIESGLGTGLGIATSDFTDAGAKTTSDRSLALSKADVILRINKPAEKEVSLLKKGCVHISYLNPFQETSLVGKFAAKKISAFSMEMIPRTTIAQKMDALSSQASLAGYVAVITAAERLFKAFPMMMTPAGTIAPSRVFIIGAGVACLQAIATAKRLGARVEAFDVRPAVEEQVKSLGASFVKIDLGDTGQTKDGYAKQLTEEQIQKQRDSMAKHCARADVVVTTAQVFGKKAPIIVTADMIKNMKKGSVVVDMAVESGGNVEGSGLDKEVTKGGVHIIGLKNLPGHVALHASQVYANNLANFVAHFWNQETSIFKIDLNDEITQGSLITHEGKIINERIKEAYATP